LILHNFCVTVPTAYNKVTVFRCCFFF